ncbi:MAG: peptidase dimerization domain protein, partial [Flavobacteriales bacterium]
MSACTPYIETHRDRFLSELFDLLRIPSVSADPAFAGDVHRCAQMVADQLAQAGAEQVEIIPTEGYPVVY